MQTVIGSKSDVHWVQTKSGDSFQEESQTGTTLSRPIFTAGVEANIGGGGADGSNTNKQRDRKYMKAFSSGLSPENEIKGKDHEIKGITRITMDNVPLKPVSLSLSNSGMQIFVKMDEQVLPTYNKLARSKFKKPALKQGRIITEEHMNRAVSQAKGITLGKKRVNQERSVSNGSQWMQHLNGIDVNGCRIKQNQFPANCVDQTNKRNEDMNMCQTRDEKNETNTERNQMKNKISDSSFTTCAEKNVIVCTDSFDMGYLGSDKHNNKNELKDEINERSVDRCANCGGRDNRHISIGRDRCEDVIFRQRSVGSQTIDRSEDRHSGQYIDRSDDRHSGQYIDRNEYRRNDQYINRSEDRHSGQYIDRNQDRHCGHYIDTSEDINSGQYIDRSEDRHNGQYIDRSEDRGRCVNRYIVKNGDRNKGGQNGYITEKGFDKPMGEDMNRTEDLHNYGTRGRINTNYIDDNSPDITSDHKSKRCCINNKDHHSKRSNNNNKDHNSHRCCTSYKDRKRFNAISPARLPNKVRCEDIEQMSDRMTSSNEPLPQDKKQKNNKLGLARLSDRVRLEGEGIGGLCCCDTDTSQNHNDNGLVAYDNDIEMTESNNEPDKGDVEFRLSDFNLANIPKTSVDAVALAKFTDYTQRLRKDIKGHYKNLSTLVKVFNERVEERNKPIDAEPDNKPDVIENINQSRQCVVM
ncbi:hypothetical protein Btru_052060 [Bulinus truncatus]|nr:hypothetical protein Btru_052060 [Bulinus truncatus]